MSVYDIRCEVLEVASGASQCPGTAETRKGESWIIGERTPEPKGMCARAFNALYPLAFAMRYSDSLPWEGGEGYTEVTCPEGFTVFKLTRLK